MMELPATGPRSTPLRSRGASGASRPQPKRRGSDPISRPARLWAGKGKGTSKEGQFIRQLRAALVQHVGGNPTAVERILIERAVMMTVHLARMDAEALASGRMSDYARKQYLAWDGKLRQALRQIGKGAPERGPSLAQYLAAQKAATALPAAPAQTPISRPVTAPPAAPAPQAAAKHPCTNIPRSAPRYDAGDG
jgi:muconolactone delta-isomerase